MRFKNTVISGLVAIIITGLIVLDGVAAEKRSASFPSYGTGPIEVRIYTDYFCPPCQAMEPAVEPVLKDLLKRNVIRLTLVDTPFNQQTPLFARYLLYALKEKNTADQAFLVRNILLEIAAKGYFVTQERLEAVFKEKNISYGAYDVKPVFNGLNALIKEDKIDATPTCVIIKGGKKTIFVGRVDILNALKELS
ncbi:MAG: thioredoxin domain-containing protein [Smithellaceae bacterium]|nr:thioredoxin domain-containing protein [Smithellaceae bacterium]